MAAAAGLLQVRSRLARLPGGTAERSRTTRPGFPAPGVAADLGPIRFARSIGRTLSPPTQAKPPPSYTFTAAPFASLQRRVTWSSDRPAPRPRSCNPVESRWRRWLRPQRPCGTSVSQHFPMGRLLSQPFRKPASGVPRPLSYRRKPQGRWVGGLRVSPIATSPPLSPSFTATTAAFCAHRIAASAVPTTP